MQHDQESCTVIPDHIQTESSGSADDEIMSAAPNDDHLGRQSVLSQLSVHILDADGSRMVDNPLLPANIGYDADIIVKGKYVTASHGRLIEKGSRYFFLDLSRNGTFNENSGKPVPPSGEVEIIESLGLRLGCPLDNVSTRNKHHLFPVITISVNKAKQDSGACTGIHTPVFTFNSNSPAIQHDPLPLNAGRVIIHILDTTGQHQIMINKFPFIIGRDRRICDYTIPLANHAVSRQHLTVTDADDKGVLVQDNSNGGSSWLAGKKQKMKFKLKYGQPLILGGKDMNSLGNPIIIRAEPGRLLCLALFVPMLFLFSMPLSAAEVDIELPMGPIIPKVEKSLYDQLEKEKQELSRKNAQLVSENKAAGTRIQELQERLQEQFQEKLEKELQIVRQDAARKAAALTTELSNCQDMKDKLTVDSKALIMSADSALDKLKQYRGSALVAQDKLKQCRDSTLVARDKLKQCRDKTLAVRKTLEKRRKQNVPVVALTTKGTGIWIDTEIGMEFVAVKSGCFQVGTQDEKSNREKQYEAKKIESKTALSAHEVCLDSFYLSRHKVTIGQYLAFLRDKKHGGDSSGVDWQSVNCPLKKEDPDNNDYVLSNNGLGKTLEQPMVAVNRHGVIVFVQWMNKRFPEKNFRLPTEAEQAFADLFVTESGSFGAMGEYGEPGMYDMAGSIWEWGQNNDKNAPENARINRTGNNSNKANKASGRSTSMGFRLVLPEGSGAN